MQPHRASTVTLVFLIFIRYLAAQVSPRNTLYQGDTLNSTSQLVSANRLFTLGFHTPLNTNNTYLAVWYTNISSGPTPVWVGNRRIPIHPNSNPILTIDHASGSLTINHTGGEPAVPPVYSSTGGMRNNSVSATLLDSGNFVLSEMNRTVLWQSFDYPTDTLLPGMKLGFNRRTGRNWTLSSWLDESNPAAGAFTMEWDPIVGRLLIRRRGVIYWTSGQMTDYPMGDLRVKAFENMYPPDVFNFNYNLTNVTNGEEEYFTYTMLIDPKWTPDDRKVISGWRLDYNGDVGDKRADSTSFTLAEVSKCYGYKPKSRLPSLSGCEMWEQPTCRNERQTFVLRAGYFSNVNRLQSDYDNDSSLGPSDCRERCWNDCHCVGYILFSEVCGRYRGGNVEFVQSLDGITNANRIYVLETAPSGKGMKEYQKIITGVLSAIVVLVLCLALFIVRKLRKGKREEEL